MTSVLTIDKIVESIITRLRLELDPRYTYHSVEHTLDVIEAAERIGHAEGLSNAELQLVKLAASYHDSGFLINDSIHEEHGCELFRKDVGTLCSPAETDLICGMIMATKIPQKPQNKLERILGDADLDYLGRADFYPIADSLFEEFKFRGVVKDELGWMELQVGFFESHHYWTDYSKHERAAQKAARLKELKERLVDLED
jgi:uncharacterized protein